MIDVQTAIRPSALTDPAVQARAREARAANAKARAASPLRRDFHSDDTHEWERLARRYGVRLPPWGESPRRATMGRFLKKVGLTWQDHREWSGWSMPETWIEHNPGWPLRAWAGLMLEYRARRDVLTAPPSEEPQQIELAFPSTFTPPLTATRRRQSA